MNGEKEQKQSIAIGEDLLKKADSYKVKAKIYLDYIIKAAYWKALESIEGSNYPKQMLKAIAGKDHYKGWDLTYEIYLRHWLASHYRSLEPEILGHIVSLGFFPKVCLLMREGMSVYSHQEFS